MKRRAALQLMAASALIGCESTRERGPHTLLASANREAHAARSGTIMATAAPHAPNDDRAAQLQRAIATLAPLHRPPPSPSPDEPGAAPAERNQSFDEYRTATRPLASDAERRTLYIQPLGQLSERQRRVITVVANYLHAFFGLGVAARPALPLALIADKARRHHPRSGTPQLLSSYLLRDILKPRRPRDAAAYVGITALELWPGKDWSYVLGESLPRDRVAVWSLYRKGAAPRPNRMDEQTLLLSALKTATHEFSHIFSLKHCASFACVMNGVITRAEADRAPLWTCPQCMAKLCWVCQQAPGARYRRLATLLKSLGLAAEAEFMRHSAEQLLPLGITSE